jgi:hypothetical protein
VTVLSFEEVRVARDGAVLATAGIAQPAAGGPVGTPTFVVRGWALGSEARALAVEIRADGRLVRVAPVREPTPDVAVSHADRPGAAHCGFLTRVHVGALDGAGELRLEAVIADGTRAAIGTIALREAERSNGGAARAPEVPSIRADVERLVMEEAERVGADRAALLDTPAVPALDEIDLEERTVLDLSGGPGHVARAARARGAALVDSVHLDDDLAALGRLIDLYHRTTRVFVHDSLDALDRTYDVVLILGPPPSVAPEALEALAARVVVGP